LAAYASVALVCAGSLVTGQAILSLCGRREPTWLSGPLGLAALLVVSGVAVKLPGHATTVAIAGGLVLIAGAAIVVIRRPPGGRPSGSAALAMAAALLALIAASIPFIANERVGSSGSVSSTTTWPTTC
jgi:hypothetical protein